MVLKRVCFGLAAALALAWGGVAMADEYRPDEFLGMDLSKAVLSPKRLGPATEFAPLAVEAKSDRGRDAQVFAGVPKKIATERVRVSRSQARPRPEPRVARTRNVQPGSLARVPRAVARVQPRGAARTRLAHRRSNPLNAQAMDTRIQTWPCNTGGICNWKR